MPPVTSVPPDLTQSGFLFGKTHRRDCFEQIFPCRKIGPYTFFHTSQQNAGGLHLLCQVEEQVFGGEDSPTADFVDDNIPMNDRQESVRQGGPERVGVPDGDFAVVSGDRGQQEKR